MNEGQNDYDTDAGPGGVRFVTDWPEPASGVKLPSGGSSWMSLSDRNAKTNCAPVDGRELLEKLARLPIQTWNYRSQHPSIRHIGPMAQDFRAAFHVGEDDKHITSVDADGVALAAIQGLNQKLEQQEAALRRDLKQTQTENAQLHQAVAELKALVTRLTKQRDEDAQ